MKTNNENSSIKCLMHENMVPDDKEPRNPDDRRGSDLSNKETQLLEEKIENWLDEVLIEQDRNNPNMQDSDTSYEEEYNDYKNEIKNQGASDLGNLKLLKNFR